MTAIRVSALQAHPRARADGFSLLEVLVALAIFAVVIIPLIDMQLNSTVALGIVDTQTRAHYLAIYTLDNILSINFKGDKTERQGEFQIVTRTTALEESQFPIERVRVLIYQVEGSGTVSDSQLQSDALFGEASAYRLINDQSQSQGNKASPSGSPAASPNSLTSGSSTTNPTTNLQQQQTTTGH